MAADIAIRSAPCGRCLGSRGGSSLALPSSPVTTSVGVNLAGRDTGISCAEARDGGQQRGG